jgi:hypothetical protein
VDQDAQREPERDLRGHRGEPADLQERHAEGREIATRRWLSPARLAAAFVGLAAWSFRKWTDVHIDFGNELYIAWQLSEGKALYRDIAHRNGPLSHYVNALAFAVGGVSLRTLVALNLALLAAITAMIHRALRLAFGRVAALVATLAFLGLFGFSQYVNIANFNYVTPYHHFQTHGVALSLALLLALDRFARGGSAAWAGGAGACLGALFLTKVELFVPAAGMALLGGALLWWGPARPRREVARGGAVLLAAALGVVAIAFGALASAMPVDVAMRGVLGNWAHLSGGLLSDRFYLAGAGLDDPVANLAAIAGATAAVLVFSGAALALDRALVGLSRRPLASAAVGGAVLLAGVALPRLVPWKAVAGALPVAAALGLAMSVRACWRQRGERDAFLRALPAALWSVWALGLLGKMLLSPRIGHYGFVLAMPATLLLVAWLVQGLPALARARGGGGHLARALAVAVVAVAVVFHWRLSDFYYVRKDFVLGSGADAMVVENPAFNRRGAVVARALERLSELMAEDDTLLVLPEGVGVNYWLRKENPTPYNLFLPTEIDAFGEGAMLRALRAHPPDFIVVMHRLSNEFGVGAFGVDPRNGRRLMDWVRGHYRRVERIGAEPFSGQGFGLVILRREGGSEPGATPGDATRSLR